MMSSDAPFVLLALMISGCGSSPCDRSAEEARKRLEACGVEFVDYDVSLAADCSEDIQNLDECYLGCYEKASCDDYVSTVPTTAFRTCLMACLAAYP